MFILPEDMLYSKHPNDIQTINSWIKYCKLDESATITINEKESRSYNKYCIKINEDQSNSIQIEYQYDTSKDSYVVANIKVNYTTSIDGIDYGTAYREDFSF